MSDHSLTNQQLSINQSSITIIIPLQSIYYYSRAMTPMRAGVTLVQHQQGVFTHLFYLHLRFLNIKSHLRFLNIKSKGVTLSVMLQSAVCAGVRCCLMYVQPIFFRLRRAATLQGYRVVRWSLCPLCGALWKCGSRTLYTHRRSLGGKSCSPGNCPQLHAVAGG